MGSRLEIEESRDGKWARVVLRGELDLASCDIFRQRLRELMTEHKHVRVDLSGLEFMDGSGAHVLADAVADAQRDRWLITLEPTVSPQVKRFIDLVQAAGWDLGF